MLGYDSVSECVDEVATDDKIEAFVDACEDFDSKSARQCLSYGRKYKRSCDESDLTDADAIKVCSEVCGNAAQMGLVLDPTNPDSLADVMTRALEISEAEYEDEAPASFSAPAE